MQSGGTSHLINAGGTLEEIAEGIRGINNPCIFKGRLTWILAVRISGLESQGEITLTLKID